MKLGTCLPELGVLVDVKDPTVAFVKSWQIIADTLNKLQIISLTNCWESNGKSPSLNLAKRLFSPAASTL